MQDDVDAVDLGGGDDDDVQGHGSRPSEDLM